MRQFGLIGRTLKHSFSKKYFAEKFTKEGIENHQYDLFELTTITEFPTLIKKYTNDLVGLNVTIPYKKEVMAYLDELDENANTIGAVNTIKVTPEGKLKGYNTDYSGFINSLKNNWDLSNKKALVLGTGGASEAIKKALTDLNIPFLSISRTASDQTLSYEQAIQGDWVRTHELIINTTPLGTYPDVDTKPNLPYEQLTDKHLLFDLVYNPEVTAFLQEGLNKGAQIKNGYAMLVGQAEASWQIWNS
ncbi:shikimate dehydrogenase [Reichenbachiella carrageenanivorans]|uniref:Shikimate dehydrogenase n=1 Tax=Reichenbachiella carrageenanivorans TaxID=2979869 RepID=A0ABY6CZC1_9BACT|nr:shikimate dehydrogenase [Reichenbachiella carrageenanivorans]UXX78138.1 shikimate dehydrogenase [Reichenbachiella carrageenanivorans]